MAQSPNRLVSREARPRGLRNRCGFVTALLIVVALLAATLPLITRVSAQATPHVTGVDPAEGKVNDTVTAAGENLGKDMVAGIFLSDDKNDYKATIVDQAADKIVMKVPQVKAGGYNLSIQSGDKILILPVRFTVNE